MKILVVYAVLIQIYSKHQKLLELNIFKQIQQNYK